MSKHVLTGEVISGRGRMAAAMTEGPRAHFYATYLGHVEPGTLNVMLPEPFIITPDMVLPRDEDGTAIYLQRCQVENLPGFILHTTKQDLDEKPVRVVEIVSAFPLRRYLRLTDGSSVRVTVTPPGTPSGDVKGRQ